MSSKTIKKPVYADYYVCDLCLGEMHLVNETRQAGECEQTCLHGKRIDAHNHCADDAIANFVKDRSEV